MKKKYKIGDLSRIFQIPVQTLRFYEEKKLITPQKDQSSGYRYYSVWNMNDLLDTLNLRSLDFPIEKIEQTLNSNSLEAISTEYMIQENELLNKLAEYQTKLRVLSEQRLRIQNFSHYLGNFYTCTNPPLIYHRHRMNHSLKTYSGSDSPEDLREELSPWVNAFPEVIATFYIPFYALNNEEISEDMEYWWGYSISCEDANRHAIRPIPPNEYLPISHCIYSVFCAGEEGTFITSFNEMVYQKILEQGYIVNGSPFGRLIVKTHENDGYKRYFEVWVPVVK